MLTENSIIKRALKSRIFLLISIIILAFILLNLAQIWRRGREIKSETTTLKQQVQTLQKGNLELTELINYLNSVAYVEEKARTDLGLKKEGEKIVVIPNTNVQTDISLPTPISEEGDKVEPDSDVKKWWQHFFANNNQP